MLEPAIAEEAAGRPIDRADTMAKAGCQERAGSRTAAEVRYIPRHISQGRFENGPPGFRIASMGRRPVEFPGT